MKNFIRYSTIAVMLLFTVMFTYSCGDNSEPKEEAPKDFTWTTASEEALADFEKGLDLLDAGESTLARESFTNAIEKDPNFAMAYALRSYTSGSSAEFVSDNNKALPLIDNVSEAEKTIIQINQTFLKGENNKRVRLYKNLTDMMPESPRAWLYRGQDFSGRDEMDTARSYFAKAITLDPNFTGAYVTSGLSYMNNEPKDFDKALGNFQKAASLSPDISYIQILVGDAHRAQNNLDPSAAAYEKALAMNPDAYAAMLKKGHVNSFLGNYDEARTDYEASLGYEDAGSQGYMFSAYTHLYNNDVEAAVAELEENLPKISDLGLSSSRERGARASIINSLLWTAFHHDMPDLYNNYVTTRNELDMEGAQEIGTENAINDAKARAVIFRGMGQILEDDFDEATASADEYNTLMANDESPNKMYFPNLLMGLNHFHQGNYEESIAALEKSDPDNLYRNYYLAKAHLGAGNEEGAMAIMEKIAIDNFNSVFYALIRNEAIELTQETASM